MSDETWRDVPDWEGDYQVSDQGRVRSLPRKGRTGRVLKGTIGPYGYPYVSLCRNGSCVTRCIHLIVAAAFLEPKPSPQHEVCHNDGDPSNAAASNLRWGTPSENRMDAVRHGTHWPARKSTCAAGHDYTEENTYWRSGPPGTRQRDCRTCRAERRARYRARIKESA